MKQKSTRGRLLRKKYLGVWRWESEPMGQNDEQVPCCPNQVYDKEEPKDQLLFLILAGEP